VCCIGYLLHLPCDCLAGGFMAFACVPSRAGYVLLVAGVNVLKDSTRNQSSVGQCIKQNKLVRVYRRKTCKKA